MKDEEADVSEHCEDQRDPKLLSAVCTLYIYIINAGVQRSTQKIKIEKKCETISM